MNNTIKLVIADDHPLLLRGLKEELMSYGYDNILIANNGVQALELIKNEEPNIAILDIEMPMLNAFEVINKALKSKIETAFIIFTSHKEKSYVYKAQKLNISGYVLKDDPFEELVKCIKQVGKGDTYFSKTFNDIMKKEISPELEKIKLLSPSERTIVRLLAQEKNTKEIAEILTISPRTVQKHRTNIIVKLKLEADMNSLTSWVKTYKELLLTV